jgi:hypothetical protein
MWRVYNCGVPRWEVTLHPEVDAWYLALDHDTAKRVEQAIDMLEVEGPSLGRPLVDHVKGARHHNMKSYGSALSASCSASTLAGRRSCS